MINTNSLKTRDELEFVIFCIENLAMRQGVNAKAVYAAIKDRSDILYNYIVPGYEFLHTQDKEYILNDIEEVMKSQGVQV